MEVSQNNIKQLLKESGISQCALSEKLGISRQQLHNIISLNRKSKYSDSIFALLKQKQESIVGSVYRSTVSPEPYRIESLPLLTVDDLLSVYLGELPFSALTKPFYGRYPFVNFAKEDDHFCLRLPQLFNNDGFYMAIGAFRFCISLQLKRGQIMILYLPEAQKIMLGRVDINGDTQERFIVNNNALHTLRPHDILLAECTSSVHVPA